MKKITILVLILITSLSLSAQNSVSGELSGLAQIKNGLRSKRISSYDRSGNNGDLLSGIKAGEKRVIAEIPGSGIINHIWITIAPRPSELNRSDIIFRMYWDGNEYPSVESPIGPFFGQGWNEQYNYSSLPLSAGPGNGTGLSCYFSMPFAKGAKIEIENQSDKTIDCFYFYIDYYETKKLPEDLGRFHAWYNHELTEALPEGETEWGIVGTPGENKDGARNYVFADIKGKGHFAGINYYVHNPGPMWYGEGDDMWFIDGETTPSLIGTGTEDFFNTSWCPKEVFSHPYFGYPRVNNEIGWLGRTHVYRFFISDPVMFEKSLKATIEHGHNNNLTLDLSSVAYWYQSEAKPLPPAPPKEARKLRTMNDLKEIHKWRHEWRKSKGNDPKLWGDED